MKISNINCIETSSLCDRACRYCPSKDMAAHRPVGLMTMDTFEATLAWVLHFSRQGTQRELNLHGIGEPTLNPLLPEMIEKARRVLPMRLPVHINSNGHWVDTSTTLITEAERAYVLSLKLAGISHIDLTGHDPFRTAKAIRVLQSANIPGHLSLDFITAPNNWAGQVDWFNPQYNAGPCPWLMHGQVFVMSDGNVTRCCIDAFGAGVMGTVFQEDLDRVDTTEFELCKSCHHEVQASRIITG